MFQENSSTSSQWTRPSIDLSAFAGQTVEIAFRFQAVNSGAVSGSDVSTGLYVDDFEIQAEVIIPIPDATIDKGVLWAYASAAASGSWVFSLLNAPTFTLHPGDDRVWEGANISLTTAAVGIPAPTFQWQKDGAENPGATGTTLALADVIIADFGLAGPLVDPTLVLVRQLDDDSTENVSVNDDWGTQTNDTSAEDVIAAAVQVGAFALEPDTKSAAVLIDVPAGRYGVITGGVDDTTGIVAA